MNTELQEMENRLTAAERGGDRHALTELLAEDFLGIDSHGRRTDKGGFIRAFCDAGLKFEHLEIENLACVDLPGPGAVVIGRSVFRATVNGRSLAASAQFLDCWQRRDERWQLVASSVTREQG